MEPLEDRRLLANLNLLASGNLIYGGGAEVNTLEVSYDTGADEYTFNDTSGTAVTPVGVAGFAALDSNAAANIVTFNATAADALLGGGTLVQIILNGNGGDDIYTLGVGADDGLRGGGGEGIDIRDDAGEGDDTINVNRTLGTAGSRLGNTVTLRSENINIGSDIFTTSSTITVGDPLAAPLSPVTITANSEIDAGTGTAAINSSGVTGAGVDLTVDGDSVQLQGDITLTGASAISLNATDSLQVGTSANNTELSSGTGTITLTGGTSTNLTDSVSTGGAVSITSPATGMGDAAGVISGTAVTVSGSLTNTSGNLTDIDATAGAVSIGGQLSSTSAVDVDATGNANFDDTVAATDIDITAATVNATSIQASAGDVDVSGATTLDGGAAALISSTGNITFDSTITGDTNNLTLQAPTLVDVDGAITNVATLRVEASGGGAVATVDLADVTAENIIVTGTAIGLSGDLAATGGTGGSVTLTGAVTVSGDPRSIVSGGDANENVTINGTIDPTLADTTNLTLDAGTLGNLLVTGATGGALSFASVTLRGDVVTMDAIDVDGDLTVNGGDIRLNGAVTGDGTGTALFAPAVPGNTLDIFNDPTHTRIGTNTRIASDTLANITAGAFGAFQFGDAATGIITINPDSDNSIPVGALDVTAPTEFVADSIILSEDLANMANTVTFQTDNLAIFRSVAGTGDTVINKKTAGGTLELRGDIGARSSWGAHELTINALGATVNAPAAGAALPALGLGANQPPVDLGGSNLTGFTVNAFTLNALASTAVVSGGDLELNVDVLNLAGGVQTTGAGTVTLGNPLPATIVENIGGGPFSILLPAGSDLSLANYDGNGGLLAIRGVGGQLGTVTLDGISDSGAVTVGTSASNDATTLNVTDDITATSIVLRGDAINLDGILESTSGNVHLLGPVTLTGDSELNLGAGALATSQVIVNGTIDGAFGLDIDAGTTRTISLTGTIGGTTPLDNMDITSGGLNFLTVAIDVVNAFSWVVGVAANGLNDRIIRAGAGAITSTNGPITLEADVLQGIIAGVNVVEPGVPTLTQRGVGD